PSKKETSQFDEFPRRSIWTLLTLPPISTQGMINKPWSRSTVAMHSCTPTSSTVVKQLDTSIATASVIGSSSKLPSLSLWVLTVTTAKPSSIVTLVAVCNNADTGDPSSADNWSAT